MSDQEPGRMFFPLEDQDVDENRETESNGATDCDIPLASDQLSLWLQNAPTFSSNSTGEAHEGYYPNMLNELSSFEVPSSPPLEQTNPGENPSLEEIVLSGLEKGQSTSSKRTPASDFLEMQTKETDLQEDGPKEDHETSDGCKPQKRTRCAEEHNLNERIRRQKLKEKMKALRELIPNCNKRDKASTLDDAIKYIKTLQHQVQEHQMMSIGTGYSTFYSPSTTMQQRRQQGMQIPRSTLTSFLQSGPARGGNIDGMEYETGTGMSSMYSSFNFPMNQLGLPDPRLLPSPATSGLLGIPAPARSVQDQGSLLEPLYTTSFQSSGSR